LRKIVVWCLAMLLVLGTTGTALSAEPKILVNGQEAFCSVSPRLVNNQVVVPIRDMAPNLKCSVGWDSINHRAILSGEMGQIVVAPENPSIMVNGQTHTIEPAPFIQDGHMFVPVRVMSEALGAEVSWDSSSRSVVVELPVEPLLPTDEAAVARLMQTLKNAKSADINIAQIGIYRTHAVDSDQLVDIWLEEDEVRCTQISKPPTLLKGFSFSPISLKSIIADIDNLNVQTAGRIWDPYKEQWGEIIVGKTEGETVELNSFVEVAKIAKKTDLKEVEIQFVVNGNKLQEIKIIATMKMVFTDNICRSFNLSKERPYLVVSSFNLKCEN
jgi:hypothetical protein